MTLHRFLIVSSAAMVLSGFLFFLSPRAYGSTADVRWWNVQSLDTMKYSRDTSREKLHDTSFERIIESQIKDIAITGATHVAIGTPYDEEFLPFLTKWVSAARRNNLNVWFRGNWSGWEGWFGYEKISRDQHHQKTKNFILNNSPIFRDGDIFTPCPECENGGPGDPRRTGDTSGFRSFLVREYQMTKEAFKNIKKDVRSNYASMNGDVATLIMDKETTKAMDGIIVIDHYVNSPERLVSDIRMYAKNSGGRVVLGEFGAPILDIHGAMDQEKQAVYLAKAFESLAGVKELVGINYWVNVGGSTRLWNDDGTPRIAVDVLKDFFRPSIASGIVQNEIAQPIREATIESPQRSVMTSSNGTFSLPILSNTSEIRVSAKGYKELVDVVGQKNSKITIILQREYESLWFVIIKTIRKILTPML